MIPGIKIDMKIVPQAFKIAERERRTKEHAVKDEIVAEVDRLVIRRCQWACLIPGREEENIRYELAAILENGLCVSLFVIDPRNILDTENNIVDPETVTGPRSSNRTSLMEIGPMLVVDREALAALSQSNVGPVQPPTKVINIDHTA